MSNPPPLESDSQPPGGPRLPDPAQLHVDPSQISVEERILDPTTGALLSERIIRLPSLLAQHPIRHHPYQRVPSAESSSVDASSRIRTERVVQPEVPTQSSNGQIATGLIENRLEEDGTAGTTNQQAAQQQNPPPQNLQDDHGNESRSGQDVELSFSTGFPAQNSRYINDRKRRRRKTRAENRSAAHRAQGFGSDSRRTSSVSSSGSRLETPSNAGVQNPATSTSGVTNSTTSAAGVSNPATSTNGGPNSIYSNAGGPTATDANAGGPTSTDANAGGPTATDANAGGPTATVFPAGGPNSTTSTDRGPVSTDATAGAPMTTISSAGAQTMTSTSTAGAASGSNIATANNEVDRNPYSLTMPLPNNISTHQHILETAERLTTTDRPPKRNGSINAFFMAMPFAKFFDARAYIDRHFRVRIENWQLVETRPCPLAFTEPSYLKIFQVKIENSRDSPISSQIEPWHLVFGYTTIRSRRFVLFHAVSTFELVRLVTLATYLEVTPNSRLTMPNDHRIACAQVGLILKAFRNRLTRARVLEVFSEDGQKVVKREMSRLGWHESDEEEDSD